MVQIIPYQESWPAEFREIAAALRQGLGSLALRIDHIGQVQQGSQASTIRRTNHEDRGLRSRTADPLDNSLHIGAVLLPRPDMRIGFVCSVRENDTSRARNEVFHFMGIFFSGK